MWLIVTVVLAILSLRGARWAYVVYLVFAVLFMPARAGFQIQSLICETRVSMSSALYSLHNWPHIVLSALVALMTLTQFRERRVAAVFAAISVTVILGLVAELEQGLFRTGHHCRMRDLVPDTAGAILGVAAGWAWRAWRGKDSMRLRKPASG